MDAIRQHYRHVESGLRLLRFEKMASRSISPILLDLVMYEHPELVSASLRVLVRLHNQRARHDDDA